MSTPEKCPHCGAPKIGSYYTCCTHENDRFPGPICRERAAHAETRKELEVTKQNAEAWRLKAARCEDEMEKQAARANAAESRVRELEDAESPRRRDAEKGWPAMSDTPRTDEAQAVWILNGCPERLRQTCAELERRGDVMPRKEGV